MRGLTSSRTTCSFTAPWKMKVSMLWGWDSTCVPLRKTSLKWNENLRICTHVYIYQGVYKYVYICLWKLYDYICIYIYIHSIVELHRIPFNEAWNLEVLMEIEPLQVVDWQLNFTEVAVAKITQRGSFGWSSEWIRAPSTETENWSLHKWICKMSFLICVSYHRDISSYYVFVIILIS